MADSVSGCGIGRALPRLEDRRFLEGRGAFLDNLDFPTSAHAVVLRSPHGHADILEIDDAAARSAPGVLLLATAADLAAEDLGGIDCLMVPPDCEGRQTFIPPHHLLQGERVRFVGDRIALVVAETRDQARDAVEMIGVEYRPRPAVVTPGAARADGAPVVWDEAPDNVCFRWTEGNREVTEAAFARAAHVVELDLVNNRIITNFIEPRATLGLYDAAQDRFTLYAGTQMPHRVRANMAGIFGRSQSDFRVVVPDVGGSFGSKMSACAEQALVLWAAAKLGRPVKWVAEKSEGFASDPAARDSQTRAALALDADGRFLAVRVDTLANMGGYLSNGTTLAAINGLTLHSGPYAMEAGFAALEGVFSNTVPTDVMRGAGRPEAIYAIERLVDAAAVELGIAPDELRRRNLIPADAFPYTTAFGLNYDSGCFESNLDSALERADWRGFSERRTATEDRGRLAGIALGYYVQRNGGRLLDENAQIRIDPSGFATLLIGTLDTGQGHETTYAQIIADRLGLNLDAIRVVERDTDLVGYGNGTGGSRSMMVGGSVTLLACQRIIDKALTIAAHLLEASTDDIAFADGRFTVSGTDRTLTLQEVAQAAYRQDLLPEEIETGLDERANFRPPNFSFPNGVYVCEVEVDPETGKVDIVRFTAAEDFGTVVNPLLVEGQVHGALAMGFGQAIHERTVFDPDSGQLLSGSLVDYALPRTTDMPPIDLAVDQSAPCLSNPLGAKGAAEGGTVGAPPVVINAILDALRPLGVAHIDMPATPERVWQAIRDAKKGTGTLRG
ncbi:MAG: xanthine dehydrogenase family protein molybdopterin-binding subunit [Alphaproteobacteria bacterium]|jgi:carbon-monoxide dehydrogenase large subunit|nr:carbon monoxide dehydrogenase [Rhodospirillaceae bacterium]MDP6404244.1 xanthine dehydrogenase family protein molybdopterin-binding subunit [Alphaproteobacteria bacterium]MDP6624394.1 xanthine dehydrogenase family protein molybdopterin-binding subunit [Alphaproteobacteria bacterium]|tara:strand:+ start:652 stop:3012 length:2361 start_codon:yes stop_codon:yes gene_type:complete